MPRSTLSKFQSTPPVRGATVFDFEFGIPQGISIHAPRAGGDELMFRGRQIPADFNPRPPCGGRQRRTARRTAHCKISIHAPRAGGDRKFIEKYGSVVISIHAPRAGGDGMDTLFHAPFYLFQSTPPVRGATGTVRQARNLLRVFQSTPPVRGATCSEVYTNRENGISIHAPRAGGDC